MRTNHRDHIVILCVIVILGGACSTSLEATPAATEMLPIVARDLPIPTHTLIPKGHPDWSVIDQLVFNASIEPFWQIYTSNLDGSNRRQLTHSQVDEWSPEWSPDGTQILFLSERLSRTNPRIYVMDANGSNVRLMYDGPAYEWGAAWSVDGSQILFTEDQPDGTADIFIMNANGSNARRIIQRGSYPSWALAISEGA